MALAWNATLRSKAISGALLCQDESPDATLLDTKLLLNSVISDSKKGARFLTIDLKDHFLQTTMEDPEYMRIHRKYFFPDIKLHYNIDPLTNSDGYVYCRIKKGMYGLKQSAHLAHEKLVTNLQLFGYQPDKFAPNIWTHNTRSTKFCLCVDDFGVKYYSTDDAHHLINALKRSIT